MEIRPATEADWPRIWPFFRAIVAAGETYAYDTDISYDAGRATWMSGHTAVAVDGDAVLGSAKMGPNHGGPGAHVANASYMVDPAFMGRGIGRALCAYSIDWCRSNGFRAMQFNAVAETNVHAVALYEKLGFTIIGTVPEAFHHPTEGYVGLHVMHRPM
jgi:L-amino acid N-acyltransferase YncA